MTTWQSHRETADSALRLFQQLHQNDNTETIRVSGSMTCCFCGLTYRKHPVEEEFNIDHRLCSGDVVHL